MIKMPRIKFHTGPRSIPDFFHNKINHFIPLRLQKFLSIFPFMKFPLFIGILLFLSLGTGAQQITDLDTARGAFQTALRC